MDAFILARLEKLGLSLAPPADRATLLRRVTFDLTGLPPTTADLEAFLVDRRPDAFARVVDRLLASPHYGERWAQHWLDIVRYAESNGYEADGERPHAWRYRDYVIRVFNDDIPYDQFVVEQLAGDLLCRLSANDDRQSADSRLLVASGFNRCGPVHLVSGNTDPEVNRQEVLTEMTGAVGSTFLGLTVACARCHNHKFDPISQADYYRLQAFFAATQPRDVAIATAQERTAYAQQVQLLNARLQPLRQQVAALDAPYRQRLTAAKKARLEPAYREALDTPPGKRSAAQKKLAVEAEAQVKVNWDEVLAALSAVERARRAGWRAQIHALEAQLPPPPAHAWAVADEKQVPRTHVLKRGNPKNKGAQVQPAFPRVLCEPPRARDTANGIASASPQRPLSRLDLARWLTRPDHPLTARVLVNRLWQHHFGQGLVTTPNDLGVRADPPSHPELLDWLACELMAHGWSIKHVQRLVLLSNTYQQSGRVRNVLARQRDPDNRLLWRMPRQRLQGEVLRDSILAVAGSLNPRMGGPMVRVPLEPAVYELIFTEGEPDGLWRVTPDVREHDRRSIYLFAKRNVRLPLLEAFDRPDSLTSCPVRPVSTFAPQALILLNGPLAQQQSKRFAARLLRECGPAPDRQIDRAYRLALARPPRATERQLARAFLASQAKLLRQRLRSGRRLNLPADPTGARPANVEPAVAAALVDFCLALLNCNEFIYLN